MRPERARNGASPAPAGHSCSTPSLSSPHSRAFPAPTREADMIRCSWCSTVQFTVDGLLGSGDAMNLAGAFVITALLGTLATLGVCAIALARWARRTGRRPWLWVLGAYVAANILWAILHPLVTRP